MISISNFEFLLFSAVQFEVDVKEEKLALLCGIAGRHVLNISDRELAFEEIGTRRIKYTFSLAWMRKFGKQQNVFFFECGRKCPSGEGVVTCVTDEATKVHNILMSKSQSMNSSRAPEPSRTKSLPAPVQQDPAPPHPKASSKTLPADIDSNIGAPSLATNALRKHPGLVKQPELIPIRPASASEGTSPPVPKRTASDRRSSAKGESIKKHGLLSEDFTKELEHKIHPPAVEAARHSKHEDKPPKDLRISKDKKKSEKEDKKKIEKDEKKKSEKDDKKLQKEGKKDKKSDKDEKKGNEEKKSKGLFSSKKKDKEEKDKPKSPPIQKNSASLYEEVDQCVIKPKSNANNSSASDIYDEAISPKTKVPVSEPVEYAQPYARKDVSKVAGSDAVMYSDVKDVQDKAWMTHGQEEEVHEEDYLNIKGAREMKEKEMIGRGNEPPPLPQKLYDIDDTYNTLDHRSIAKPTAGMGTQNIYGTAGAKPVGRIDIVAAPKRTPKGSISGSEGSSGEIYEGSDEEPEGEQTYDGYEETQITKPALKPKPAPQPKWQGSAMYEEIPSPPVTSPVKTKPPQSFQESLYDEVS